MTVVEFERWVLYHKSLHSSPPKGKHHHHWYLIPVEIQKSIVEIAGSAFGVLEQIVGKKQ